MLLTITTTHTPATDLGYLLHKHPDRLQCFDLSFGKAKVFYPEASQECCSVALLLEIDRVGLVRRSGKEGLTLQHYINDRPYVASSFLSVAIARVFGTALGGRCKNKPKLVQTPIPLTAKLPVLPCYGGESIVRRLFEPLGYAIDLQQHPLDENFTDWGDSPYFTVKLQQTVTLQTLLSHLYVLIPVLDADKHYWIGDDEVEKLLRHGDTWLASHPEQKLIARRYLKRQGRLVRAALAQLAEEDSMDVDGDREIKEEEEAQIEKPLSLNEQRLATVVTTLKQVSANRILDLGCGEGKLLRELIKEKTFTEIVGVDVSYRCLERAKDKLHWDRLPPMQQKRLQLLQGSLMYRDRRLEGYDAATLIEVIEHLDPPRLAAMQRVLFEFTRPQTIIITTPNREYNVKFESLSADQFRHKDHRFEWTRQEFQDWANEVGKEYAYTVQFYSIGTVDPILGSPTQMGLFVI